MAWYQASPWRNLVDMHIPDWNPDFLRDFDPERYADCMKEAGVDTALVYAGNCLGICFFPTKAGHMHAGLHGRDIFGETAAALKARGIRPVTYFNIWSRWAYDTHPDWRIYKPDGSTTLTGAGGVPSRYGCCCLNAPGYREYVQAQITQLAQDYDTAGFWIDMCGWHGAVCTCGHCRARYLRETGREIPKTVDWDDPAFTDFIRARERWLFDFNAMIRRTVDAVRPGMTVAFQSAFWRSGPGGGFSRSYADLSDYIAGDFYGNPLMYSWYCKFLSNLSPNRPMEFMISRCQSLNDHTTTKTDAELHFSAYAALAHGASFLFIDAIDPAGTLDGRLYRRMGRLKSELKPLLDTWDPEARVVPEVCFFWGFPSMYDPACGGPLTGGLGPGVAARMENAARTMIASHLTFDFVPDLDSVPAGAVLVLSEQYVLTDRERRFLYSFVENGGKLVVTGLTGSKDITGFPASLDALTGVTAEGVFPEDTCYLSPCGDAEALFEEASAAYPLFYTGAAPRVRVTPDTQILSVVTRAAAHSHEIHRFGSAISNPPLYPTDCPAVTRRRVGKGEVLWIGVPLFDAATERQRRVFSNLIRTLLPARTAVETDAPSWMEVMLRRSGKRTYITLYKAMQTYYETAPADISLSIALPGASGSLRDVLGDEAVDFSAENGRIRWTARAVSDFAQFIWEENA